MPPASASVGTRATWGTALVLGALAATATVLANMLIARRFPDAPKPDDLMFELLPYVEPARWLTVLALVGGFGLFLLDILRSEGVAGLVGRRMADAGAVFGLMYLLRAGIMVLTPLAPAQPGRVFIFDPPQLGMFPSGHVAAVTLLVLLSPTERPWVRRVQWVMLGLMVAGLLLARGHYSIDIVGGLLLGYAVVQAWRTPRWPVLARLSGRLRPGP